MVRKIRYKPHQNEVFSISRTGVELFLRCKRCFYLSTLEKYDISIPSSPMSYLPNAVDEMLKNSHDVYRKNQESHPYMIAADIRAVPFQHENLDDWRKKSKGIRYLHQNTNLELFGLVDDVWRSTQNNELFVVDYKTTTVKREKKTMNKKIYLGREIRPDLNEKGAAYKYWYKKQVEFYQWLLRKNNFTVSNNAYFLFCSAKYKEIYDFDDKMQFRIDIIKYVGNDNWVDDTIINIKNLLDGEVVPKSNPNCNHCNYVTKIINAIN